MSEKEVVRDADCPEEFIKGYNSRAAEIADLRAQLEAAQSANERLEREIEESADYRQKFELVSENYNELEQSHRNLEDDLSAEKAAREQDAAEIESLKRIATLAEIRAKEDEARYLNHSVIEARTKRANDSLRKKVERAREALEYIANPIAAMQAEAERDGREINGVMAHAIASDARHLSGRAATALAQLSEGTEEE